MTRLLLFPILLFTTLSGSAQALSLDNLITATEVADSKVDNYFSQKGYVRGASFHTGDTLTQLFAFRGKKRQKTFDTTFRELKHTRVGRDITVDYSTCSQEEFQRLKDQLLKTGFKTSDSIKTETLPLVYQHGAMTMNVSTCFVDSMTAYTFSLRHRLLPGPKDIQFAEDLLMFNSHANLVHVFGSGNVKNDIYYFSATEFNRCSVLFPNSNRQAVFIWKDEANDRDLAYLVLGGQLMVQGSFQFTHPIAENAWMLRNRVRAGMSISELRRINGLNFTFHNVSSEYSGMIIHDGAGSINFEKESIVLACLNCGDMKHSTRATLTADEAIQQGRRFFVFTIMLYPTESQ